MTPGEETAKQGSLSLKEMEDNIARLPSVYNSLPWNAFCFLQVETFFFRGRETSAIRWLVQKKNPVAQSGELHRSKEKRLFFLYPEKKDSFTGKGWISTREVFFPRSSSTSERGRTHGIRAVRPLCWAIRFLFPDGGPTGSPDSRQRVRVFFPSLLQLVSRVA